MRVATTVQHLDFSLDDIHVTQHISGLTAEVRDPPGCIAAAAAAPELDNALTMAMYIYFDERLAPP